MDFMVFWSLKPALRAFRGHRPPRAPLRDPGPLGPVAPRTQGEAAHSVVQRVAIACGCAELVARVYNGALRAVAKPYNGTHYVDDLTCARHDDHEKVAKGQHRTPLGTRGMTCDAFLPRPRSMLPCVTRLAREELGTQSLTSAACTAL